DTNNSNTAGNSSDQITPNESEKVEEAKTKEWKPTYKHSSDCWETIPVSEKPAESPFRECFFDTLPEDLSSIEGLSDIESQALKSIQTLTNLLGLSKPLAQFPKFPLKFDKVEDFWKLVSIGFMNTVQHPISFGIDGNGWPFVVIKALNAKDTSIERPIFLYCGPQGSHAVQWDGWWENHCSNSVPCFFSKNQFIHTSGALMGYPENIIQRFKDFMTKGEAEDDYENKWILATASA
ncbi:MAG TPA: hypothetical protein VIH61_08755, partial [Waddliaceae bacterium]